jgi:EmrB/QacA subfamily drug resistance transporter
MTSTGRTKNGTTPNGTRAAPRPAHSRWAALAVLCAGMLMVILDGTIVSVALPAIQADLGFTATGLAWTVNAYLVPLGGLLLLAGRLGDLLGRRRMLVVGLALFVVASLLCGFAVGAGMLVAARFLQGVAAAMASAVVLGMIVGLFPEPGERARAIGVYAFVGAAGASIGTLLGGVLTETVGWRWIFLVNVPIGVAAVLLSLRVIERDRPVGGAGRPDLVGGLLVTAGLVLAVFTIVDTSGPQVRIGLAALALALLVGFVVRQSRAADPLVRLGIFRSRAVSGGNLVQLLMVAGMLGFQFTAALHLQGALGYAPAETGLALLPIPVTIAVVSLAASGRLIARFGPRPVLLVGEVLLVAGLLLLTRPPAGSYLVDVLPSMLVLGVGAGLSLPAVTTVMMSDATPADAGLASGLANTSQQVGGALGIAVLAALATARTDAATATGVPQQEALAGGYHLAFAAGATAVALAALLTLTVLRPRPRLTPQKLTDSPPEIVGTSDPASAKG